MSGSTLSEVSVFCIEGKVFVFQSPVEKNKGGSEFINNDPKTRPIRTQISLCSLFVSPSSSCPLTTPSGMPSNCCLSSVRSSCRLRSAQSRTPETKGMALYPATDALILKCVNVMKQITHTLINTVMKGIPIPQIGIPGSFP